MQLPLIEITIDGVKYENTFQQDVSIDRTNIETELATHAEKYAYYGFLSSLAKAKAAYAKMERDQVYARLDAEKRKLAAAVTGLKYTEKMCENEVITDKRYVEIAHRYLDLELLADQLEKAERAMSQRREMLVQLGGISRQMMAPQRVVEQQSSVAADLIERSRAQTAPQTTPYAPPPPPAPLAEAPQPEAPPAPAPAPVVETAPPRRRRQ